MLNLTRQNLTKTIKRYINVEKSFLDIFTTEKDYSKIENDKKNKIDLQNEIQRLQKQAEIEVDELSEKYDRQQQTKFEQNEKKFQDFLDNYKSINDKLEEYILQCKDPVERQFRFEKFKEALETKQIPVYLKNIHENTNYLDTYNRYDFYESNYIEQVQNSDLRIEDEQKYRRRDEGEFIKQIINYFYKNLDTQIENEYKESKPLTLKAKMLKRIKDYEKEHVRVPGFIEGKFDETSEPGNKDFVDASGKNEIENFTFDDENEALKIFEDEFLKMLQNETQKYENTKQFQRPKADFEEMYFMDADTLENNPLEIDQEGEKRMENVFQFTLRAQLQIYEYFLKGWKVRELCRRFGATPLKIKMIIFSLQNFFETVLPQVSLARACHLFYLEDQDNVFGQKKVDYGADLPLLMEMQHGRVRNEFPRDSFRHLLRPSKEKNISEEDIYKYELTVKKPNDKLVPENFITKGKEPYLVQNWIPQKGKGSLKVTTAFRELIERSHYKGYFTPETEKKRQKGPRYGAMGKGHKQIKIKKLQMNNLQQFNDELRQKLQQVECLQNNRIYYGTSGFRYEAEALPFIAFRVGLFLGVYGQICNAQALGLTITASHNPIKDNGLKIIQPNGEMLELKIEKILEDFVNEDNLQQGLDNLYNKLEVDESSKEKVVVILGHDSRPSAEEICNAFKKGAETQQMQILEAGLSTTPQVYWYVYNYNQHLKNNSVKDIKFLQEEYINKISNNAKEILEMMDSVDQKKQIYVDCSGGVGTLPLRQFIKIILNQYYDIYVINPIDDNTIELNNNIGAEYVHKKESIPKNLPKEAKYCVTFDGDADRIVYFNVLDHSKNQIEVIDGDKQMALMTLVINKVFNQVLNYQQKLDFIAIMTQYSNFGAEKFFQKINMPVVRTPTGVKHTHHEAVKHDMAVYYESNGHGSLIISPEFVKKCESIFDMNNKEQLLAWKIFNFHNSLTGDAVFNFIQIELYLKYMNMTNEDFANLFIYKPHLTYKLKVKRKNNCKADEWQGKLLQPLELVDYVEQLQKEFQDAELRIFIRASGTEDVLRVHLEWSDQNNELLNSEEKQQNIKL